jgi:hypothetical protein
MKTDTITIKREDWETMKSQFQLISAMSDDDSTDDLCNAGLAFMSECEHHSEARPTSVNPWMENDKAPGDTRRYLIAIDDGMAMRRVGFGWRKWKSELQISDWWETDQGLVHDSIITHYAEPIELP